MYHHDCVPRSRITRRVGLLTHFHLRASFQRPLLTRGLHLETIYEQKHRMSVRIMQCFVPVFVLSSTFRFTLVFSLIVSLLVSGAVLLVSVASFPGFLAGDDRSCLLGLLAGPIPVEFPASSTLGCCLLGVFTGSIPVESPVSSIFLFVFLFTTRVQAVHIVHWLFPVLPSLVPSSTCIFLLHLTSYTYSLQW